METPESNKQNLNAQLEGKATIEHVIVGMKTVTELQDELASKKINVDNHAINMLASGDMTSSETSDHITLVRVRVIDLGIIGELTTKKIFDRVEKLGLKLCTPKTGVYYRLQYTKQPHEEEIYIGMKQIIGMTDDGPYENIFGITNCEKGLELKGISAEPSAVWHPNHEFIFEL